MPWRRKEKGGGEKERPVEKSRSGASGEEEDIDIDIGTASSVAKHKLVETNKKAFLCLPGTRIANAVNAREIAERALLLALR
ncbi:hypothetical protein NC653_039038 [Populus alba x Populus x berolinensis]|uniref:Uncharacterized protein n=1 Tax=Populus alba x Populus x berolinensis TaxID=444605 RepID=A0AAD6LA84_9ROSI|nr:hypothetical protein NC653_039038 [Populus alba x Populus x berolinensis]